MDCRWLLVAHVRLVFSLSIYCSLGQEGVDEVGLFSEVQEMLYSLLEGEISVSAMQLSVFVMPHSADSEAGVGYVLDVPFKHTKILHFLCPIFLGLMLLVCVRCFEDIQLLRGLFCNVRLRGLWIHC